MKFLKIGLIVLIVFSYACKKDVLTGDLEVFKGQYTWVYSQGKAEWWDTDLTTYYAENYSYTAEIQFDNEGRIHFYINSAIIHSTRFKIEQRDTFGDGGISITINPATEDSKNIDLNDVLSLTLIGDTLTANDYPGESYDSSLGGTSYFIRNQ